LLEELHAAGPGRMQFLKQLGGALSASM